MAVVDIFVLLIFSFSILMGFYRGVIWEFLKYIAFAIAITLTAFTILKSHSMIANSNYPLAVGVTIGIIIFVASLIITLGIAQWISKQLRNTGFGNSDRILGLIFGFVRASVFTLLLYSGMMLISKNQKPEWVKESIFAGILDSGHKRIEKMVYSINSPKLNRLLNIDLAIGAINTLTGENGAESALKKGSALATDLVKDIFKNKKKDMVKDTSKILPNHTSVKENSIKPSKDILSEQKPLILKR